MTESSYLGLHFPFINQRNKAAALMHFYKPLFTTVSAAKDHFFLSAIGGNLLEERPGYGSCILSHFSSCILNLTSGFFGILLIYFKNVI